MTILSESGTPTNVSVVIPTYGRGEKIGATLDALLASETGGLGSVEVLVVDDGSPVPIDPIVEARGGKSQVALRCLRQENAGPAKARNTGFRASSGEVVVFIDDDILCPPDLVKKHVEAHRRHPGSVVYGRCPYAPPEPMTPFFRYLDSLGHDSGKNSEEEFVPMTVVASGQLSVERAMFDAGQGVYRDDLATPAAEEFELALRLHDRSTPIYFATRIVALHNHPVDIEVLCRQAFKHSKGIVEVVKRYPRTVGLKPELGDIIRANGPVGPGDTPGSVLKKAVKRAFAAYPSRAALLLAVRLLERAAPADAVLAPMYKALLSAHMMMGVRSGLAPASPR